MPFHAGGPQGSLPVHPDGALLFPTAALSASRPAMSLAAVPALALGAGAGAVCAAALPTSSSRATNEAITPRAARRIATSFLASTQPLARGVNRGGIGAGYPQGGGGGGAAPTINMPPGVCPTRETVTVKINTTKPNEKLHHLQEAQCCARLPARRGADRAPLALRPSRESGAIYGIPLGFHSGLEDLYSFQIVFCDRRLVLPARQNCSSAHCGRIDPAGWQRQLLRARQGPVPLVPPAPPRRLPWHSTSAGTRSGFPCTQQGCCRAWCVMDSPLHTLRQLHCPPHPHPASLPARFRHLACSWRWRSTWSLRRRWRG